MSSSVSLRFRASAKAAVQCRLDARKRQRPLSDRDTPCAGEVAPLGQQLSRRAEMPGQQAAVFKLRPVHAHGERRGFVRVYLDREALRRERQVPQQKIRKVAFAQRGDE